jgi:hypothetical protein
MSLRTYSLITHPAYIRYVEGVLFGSSGAVGTDLVPPRIEKISDIAEYMKISHRTIRMLLINTANYYRSFEMPKKSGGSRTIQAPRLFLKVVQWWIKDTILDCLPVDDAVHGFVKERSFVSNAQAHLGARHVLNVDIASCFDSADAKLIEKVYLRAGYSSAISLQLAILCSLNKALPQGAPTSPALLNQILKDFDEEVKSLTKDRGVTYSRYADDLTFSSRDRIDGSLVDIVAGKLGELSFKLNASKTHYMGANERKIVTGLVLGDGKVSLQPEFLNSLRGWIGSIERQGRNLSDLDAVRLRGTLSTVSMVGGNKSSGLLQRGRKILAEYHESSSGGNVDFPTYPDMV